MRIGIGTHRARFDGFLPDDIGSLAIWLRADKGIDSVGGAVEFWDFENGTFRGVFRVAQGAGANRPTHIVSDPAYNNQSIISFDGGDNLDTPNFTAPLAQPTTYFIVGNVNAIGGTNVFFDRAGGAGRNQLTTRVAANDYAIFSGFQINSAPGAVDTSAHILEVVFNGASSEMFLDTLSIITGIAGAQSLDSLRVGNNITNAQGLTGNIAEIIIYDALLSDADRSSVRTYLSNRYNISI